MSVDATGDSHHSDRFIWDDLASVITSLCPLSKLFYTDLNLNDV